MGPLGGKEGRSHKYKDEAAIGTTKTNTRTRLKETKIDTRRHEDRKTRLNSKKKIIIIK